MVGAALAAGLALGGCGGGQPATVTASDPSAPTQDAATRASPVVPGRRARVFIFAGLGPKCEALPAPQITVTAPPQKGDLSFEPGQSTVLTTATNPACVGKPATGTGLYYTARAGSDGVDQFAVEARTASGDRLARTFAVRIEP